jgi:small ligand-binding sensory domain FIST
MGWRSYLGLRLFWMDSHFVGSEPCLTIGYPYVVYSDQQVNQLFCFPGL